VAETVLNQQESKLEPSTDTQRQNNHLKRIAGIILSLIMIALTGYVLNLQNQNTSILSSSTNLALTAGDYGAMNYRTYVGKYKETKIELDETTRKLEEVNRQLDQVTVELATTKGMLTQTQGMLSAAQDENTKLKQELQGLDNLRNTENVQNIGELQDKIQALKDKDSQVSVQLADLKTQLRAFEGQFSNPEEGQSLIVLFQNKIRLVKTHMRYLKQEAFFARVAAQKEKDRLAVLNGNSGFMMRNGQAQNPNGTNKSFAIDVKIVQ
jgi:septal ring factor EnvC (AmiA/AmiB activator)